jgi:hypothetical protein
MKMDNKRGQESLLIASSARDGGIRTKEFWRVALGRQGKCRPTEFPSGLDATLRRPALGKRSCVSLR